MLTRLEVQGFKNLVDVAIDFGPFTCIAGANGMGKSNVFDAIEFLSYLATEPLVEASQRVRGASGLRGGDPRDLFWDGYRDHEHRIHLAAEMIVPTEVEDDLGAPANPTTTFLRYEVTLGFERPTHAGSLGRLSLLGEELRHIRRGEAIHHLRFGHSAKKFRSAVIRGERRGGAFLSTEHREGGTVINVHGDGGSFGKPQPRAAGRAGRGRVPRRPEADPPAMHPSGRRRDRSEAGEPTQTLPPTPSAVVGKTRQVRPGDRAQQLETVDRRHRRGRGSLEGPGRRVTRREIEGSPRKGPERCRNRPFRSPSPPHSAPGTAPA